MTINAPPFEHLTLKAEELMASAQRAPEITSKEIADKYALLITQFRQLLKAMDDARATEKRPALDEASKIEERWRVAAFPIAQKGVELKGKLTAWLTANEQSKAGDDISVDDKKRPVHLTTYRYAKIVHEEAALHYFRKHPKIIETLQQVCNEAVRKDKDAIIPGVTIVEDRRVG